MTILFPSHPLKGRLPDPDYEAEFEAARSAGLECVVFGLEALRAEDTDEAFKFCAPAGSQKELLVYRGWMMSDNLYAILHTRLVALGYAPVTDPSQYAEAHYLPNAYAHLKGRTPESRWMRGKDIEEAWNLYQGMSGEPVIVKDWVKSAKHLWDEACFIPAGTPRSRFQEIMQAFLGARRNLFEKGIVFRKFHSLRTLGNDLRGQPVHEEYRMFFWDADLLAATPALDDKGPFDNLDEWKEIASRFSSRFLTMDVARQEDRSWIIIEVGDGGVSGLPASIDPNEFYSRLQSKAFPS